MYLQPINDGKVVGLVSDFAGSACDFACRAPPAAMDLSLKNFDIYLTDQQIRVPMGKGKIFHLADLYNSKACKEQWIARWGEESYADKEGNVKKLFAFFLDVQDQFLIEYRAMIPGMVEAVEDLRAEGKLIGSTTGYTGDQTELLLDLTGEDGYRVDSSVSADGTTFKWVKDHYERGTMLTPEGRPKPWMCLGNPRLLNAPPVMAWVKYEDTGKGITAARDAGMWAVGAGGTGSELNLARGEELTDEELEPRIKVATEKLFDAGAHYVIRNPTKLVDLVHHIESRLARGHFPSRESQEVRLWGE